jgi:metal-sulfur cluster biosynthetic enzyme
MNLIDSANAETLTPLESSTLDSLRQVIDPEVGCNLVELGLIYDVSVRNSKAHIIMTLTSTGCPMNASLVEGVASAALNTPGVDDVEVELVWEPAWTPDRIARSALVKMGREY